MDCERITVNDEDCQAGNQFQKKFKETMTAALAKRFSESNDNFSFYQKATFLDPTYKTQYFGQSEDALICITLWFKLLMVLLS